MCKKTSPEDLTQESGKYTDAVLPGVGIPGPQETVSASGSIMVPALASPDELAAILRVPIGTIYYWLSKSVLPIETYFKAGRHYRFYVQAVIDFFSTQTRDLRCIDRTALSGFSRKARRSLKIKNAAHAGLQPKE